MYINGSILAALASTTAKQETISRGNVPYYRTGEKEERSRQKHKRCQIKKYPSRRWVVDRTKSWHNQFRNLYTRYEKKNLETIWVGTVSLLYNYLQENNFGIGSVH